MDWWHRIEWRNPEFLVLWIGIPFLWYYLIYKKNTIQAVLQYPNIHVLPKQKTWKLNIFNKIPYLLLLGIFFGILSLARPQFILKEEKVEGQGIDIFLSMDLSSSMLSQDFDPNRLEVSKAVASDFVDKRIYDRIGVVGFAGEGFTQCPLTTDKLILKDLIHQMQCGLLEDGTAIGEGIATAINRLKNDSTLSKIIILITDGVNNAGQISPALAMEMAKTFNIKIYTIGVGSMGEAYSPVGRNNNGEYIFGMAPVTIDENLLHEIAQQTGGKYYRATSIDQLKEIYSDIDKLEKTKIEVTVFKRYNEEFKKFAIIGLILILLYWILNYLIFRPLPHV